MSFGSDIGIDDESFENDNQVRNAMFHQYKLAAMLATVEVAKYHLRHVLKEKKRTSILTRHMWLEELKAGNENRFFE